MQDVAKYAEENIAVSKLDNLESVSDATELILSSYTRNVIQFANSAAYRNLGQVTSYQELNIDFEMVRTAWDAQSYLSRVFGTEKNGAVLFLRGKEQRFCDFLGQKHLQAGKLCVPGLDEGQSRQ